MARKFIYIPIYYEAVKNTEAFRLLKEKYEESQENDETLYLVDFDAYRHRIFDMSYSDVVDCEKRKMGHAFVLAMMLECPEALERTVEKNKKEIERRCNG